MGFETSKQPPRRVNIAAIFSRSSMKRILSIFLCLTLILGFCPGQTAYAAAEWPSEISISADGGILMDINSGAVLFEKNSHEPYYPASITKIMTLILIFDALDKGSLKMDDTVTTSAHAKSMGGSQVFLEEGEIQTVETLIKCIVIASGNDASVAWQSISVAVNRNLSAI